MGQVEAGIANEKSIYRSYSVALFGQGGLGAYPVDGSQFANFIFTIVSMDSQMCNCTS